MLKFDWCVDSPGYRNAVPGVGNSGVALPVVLPAEPIIGIFARVIVGKLMSRSVQGIGDCL